MKKQYVNLLAAILSVCGILSSCGDKMNKKTGAFEFNRIQANKTVHLFGDTANPGANIIVDIEYITKASDNKLKDSLNVYFASACFGERYMDTDMGEIVNLYTQNYMNEYRQDLEPMYAEDLKNKENEESIPAWYSFYKGVESHVQFYEGDLLVYRVDYNEYTGGAHGVYMSTFLNFDLKNIQKIALDDIFTGNYKEPLSELLWKQLMADQEAKSRSELEDMGYGSTGDLIPTENFYLDKEGITFHYNVYEFTPYVMGATRIKLSYESVEPLLGDNKVVSRLKK